MIENWTTENILIGQMAKMHNVSAKMLRYRDKIGILKPAETNEINGYNLSKLLDSPISMIKTITGIS